MPNGLNVIAANSTLTSNNNNVYVAPNYYPPQKNDNWTGITATEIDNNPLQSPLGPRRAFNFTSGLHVFGNRELPSNTNAVITPNALGVITAEDMAGIFANEYQFTNQTFTSVTKPNPYVTPLSPYTNAPNEFGE